MTADERLARLQEIESELRGIDIRRDALSRNDPCPCGSGKKFKKCCGAA